MARAPVQVLVVAQQPQHEGMSGQCSEGCGHLLLFVEQNCDPALQKRRDQGLPIAGMLKVLQRFYLWETVTDESS